MLGAGEHGGHTKGRLDNGALRQSPCRLNASCNPAITVLGAMQRDPWRDNPFSTSVADFWQQDHGAIALPDLLVTVLVVLVVRSKTLLEFFGQKQNVFDFAAVPCS